MLKRGHDGVYLQMSKKQLSRYVNEFVYRHNVRDMDTIEQMEWITMAMKHKKLPYKRLIE